MALPITGINTLSSISSNSTRGLSSSISKFFLCSLPIKEGHTLISAAMAWEGTWLSQVMPWLPLLVLDLKRTSGRNPAVVYSKTWCSYYMGVKSLFKKFGVQPLVIELDEMGPHGPQLQKALGRLTSERTVPNVFIGCQELLVEKGEEVANTLVAVQDTVKLYRKGELEPLLSEATAKTTER